MLDFHFRSWEIVNPRNLTVSTANTMLLSMVRDGTVLNLPDVMFPSLTSCLLSVRTFVIH